MRFKTVLQLALVTTVTSSACLGPVRADVRSDLVRTIDALVAADAVSFTSERTIDDLGLCSEVKRTGQYVRSIGLHEVAADSDGSEYEQWMRPGIRVWRHLSDDPDTWSFRRERGVMRTPMSLLRTSISACKDFSRVEKGNNGLFQDFATYVMKLEDYAARESFEQLRGDRVFNVVRCHLELHIGVDDKEVIRKMALKMTLVAKGEEAGKNQELRIMTNFEEISATPAAPPKEVLAVLEAVSPISDDKK